MALQPVLRGSIRGPQGLQGPQGVQGPAGRTLDPEGSVATKAELAAKTGMVKGHAWTVAENKHIYVYEGNEAPTSGVGYDSALPGWTDFGDISGPKGDQGIQGIQGVQGQPGATGSQGVKGDTGAQGTQGIKGDTGSQGPQGIQGVKGDKGDTGNTGAAGAQGVKGDTGNTGAQGIQGIQGVKGDTGTAGSRWRAYGGSTGVTQAQAVSASALYDWIFNVDTGETYEIRDV